jgi:hypothetical protein
MGQLFLHEGEVLSLGCRVQGNGGPMLPARALNRTSMPLMVEELVKMRLGSQELQQKRNILKITMQNSCMNDAPLTSELKPVPGFGPMKSARFAGPH